MIDELFIKVLVELEEQYIRKIGLINKPILIEKIDVKQNLEIVK